MEEENWKHKTGYRGGFSLKCKGVHFEVVGDGKGIGDCTGER